MTDSLHLTVTDPSPRRRPTPRLIAAAAGLVTVVAMTAGCSGASFDDTAATTTTSKSTTTESDGFDRDATQLGTELINQLDPSITEPDELEAGCLGQALTDALGSSEAQELTTTQNPTSDQLDAISAAFDACVKGTTLAPSLTEGFFSELPGSPTPDQSVVSCVAGEIDGKTGTIIVDSVNSEQSDTLPTEVLATFDVCVPDDIVAGLLVDELTSDGTFDATQAACIADRVAAQLSITELAAAGKSGSSDTVTKLVEDATLACISGT